MHYGELATGQSPDQWHFAGCLAMLQSDTASTITNLISWFSFFDFTTNIKQAGDEIFTCASLCQKLSLYGTMLQSYCTNKKGAIFYASQRTSHWQRYHAVSQSVRNQQWPHCQYRASNKWSVRFQSVFNKKSYIFLDTIPEIINDWDSWWADINFKNKRS